MQVPEFVKEVIWTFFPPRYKQLSDQKLTKSILFMSKILAVAFLITALLFIPKLALLKSTVQSELTKFDSFNVSFNITQSAPITIPKSNPWIFIDLNNNHTLTRELLVVDEASIQYRAFTVNKFPRSELTNLTSHVSSMFFTMIVLLMVPGVALLLYIRMWIKYFLLVILAASLFFIFAELTRYKLKWKQMANIACHAIVPAIFVEVISSFISTVYLIPVIRFLGVTVHAIPIIMLAGMMVVGVIGCQIIERKKKK